jgi:hypothetical protein
VATKKQDILVKITANPIEQIKVWIDKPSESITDVLSIEGVSTCRASAGGPLYIMVDPRYDVREVAGEIEALLTAEVPDIFKEI